MAMPRFTMVVLLIEDLPRSLRFNAYVGMVDDPDGNTVLITAG